MSFDAFISYSHSSDGELAPDLQRGLQQLAKPWSRRQALNVFRDDTGLSVSPALWASITGAMEDSRYFVLMASPTAAESEWVNREIEHWMSTQPDASARILPVLTEGSWVWDEESGDMDFAASTAAPAALAGVFAEEPRHLDLSWARGVAGLTLADPRFRDAVADLAAPIHGIPKDDLEGEAIRQHRRAVRIRRVAIAALVLLVLGLGIAGCFAVQSAEDARNALRDLEDANGNIVELEAEGNALEQANAQAAADLADTEAAKAQADELAAQAQREADLAVEARAEAEEARSAAEVSRAQAEAAKEEADLDRAAAEEARDAATEAQAEAEAAAAAAEANEAAAREAEATARAAEDAAREAEEQAKQNEDAAREAEEQAREDEAAARDAETEARAQEERARGAQAAAEAAADVARAAEAEAVAAEAAARAAETAAREQQALAEAAAQAADEARAVAELRRAEAEAAERAAALARASASAGPPDVSALLAAESYCAVSPCETAPAGIRAPVAVSVDSPMGLRSVAPANPGSPTGVRAAVAPAQAEPAEPPTLRERLDPLLPMIGAVVEHGDIRGALPGWSGAVRQVAVSDDGATIAAVRRTGTVRIWTPARPGGYELDGVTDVIAVDLAPDGTTLAYLTATEAWVPDGVPEGARERLFLLELAGSPPPSERGVRFDFSTTVEPHTRARLEINPADPELVLLTFDETQETMVSFPIERHPFPDEVFGEEVVVPLDGTASTWRDADTVYVFGPGDGHVEEVDGTRLDDIANPSASARPVVAVSRGERIGVGYSDGSVASIPTGSSDDEVWIAPGLLSGGVRELDFGPGTRHLLVSDGERTVGRVRVGTFANVGFQGPDDPQDPRNRAVLDTLGETSGANSVAAGSADLAVIGLDETLYRFSAAPGAAADTRFEGVVATPSTQGVLLPSGDGAVLAGVQGPRPLPGVEQPRGLSPDGSFVVFGDRCAPRVASAASPADSRPLQIPGNGCIESSRDERVWFDPAGSRVLLVVECVLDDSACSAATSTRSSLEVMTFDVATGQLVGQLSLGGVGGGGSEYPDVLAVSSTHFAVRVVSGGFGRFNPEDVFLYTIDGEIQRAIRGFRAEGEGIPEPRPAAAFEPGPGGALLLGSDNGAVLRFDTDPSGQGDGIALDVGSLADVNALATSDSGLIAVGLRSGSLELWDLATGVFVTELTPHDTTVDAIAFGQVLGGWVVASTGTASDGIVRGIDDAVALRGALCDVAGRDLSAAEWNRYVGVGDPQPCRRGLG